jgi:hypothetical protein
VVGGGENVDQGVNVGIGTVFVEIQANENNTTNKTATCRDILTLFSISSSQSTNPEN